MSKHGQKQITPRKTARKIPAKPCKHAEHEELKLLTVLDHTRNNLGSQPMTPLKIAREVLSESGAGRPDGVRILALANAVVAMQPVVEAACALYRSAAIIDSLFQP